MRRRLLGFSLMELLIVLAILAILVIVAIPSYRSYMLKSNRSDAIRTLLAIQLAQEKYRVSNATYGTLGNVWSGVATTEGGHYTLTITAITATTYTITANGVGAQASDTADGGSCAAMVLSYVNGTTTKTPAACWMDN